MIVTAEKIIELPVIQPDELPPAVGGCLSNHGNQAPSVRPELSWHAQFSQLPPNSNAGIVNLPPQPLE